MGIVIVRQVVVITARYRRHIIDVMVAVVVVMNLRRGRLIAATGTIAAMGVV